MTISQSKPRSDSSSRSRSVRSVRFAPRTKVYLVQSSKDMTDEEISSTWTSDKGTKRNHVDVVKTVKAMRQTASSSRTKRHNADNGGSFCTRGLEHMQNAEHLEQRNIDKESVIDAVLDGTRQTGNGMQLSTMKPRLPQHRFVFPNGLKKRQ